MRFLRYSCSMLAGLGCLFAVGLVLLSPSNADARCSRGCSGCEHRGVFSGHHHHKSNGCGGGDAAQSYQMMLVQTYQAVPVASGGCQSHTAGYQSSGCQGGNAGAHRSLLPLRQYRWSCNGTSCGWVEVTPPAPVEAKPAKPQNTDDDPMAEVPKATAKQPG